MTLDELINHPLWDIYKQYEESYIKSANGWKDR